MTKKNGCSEAFYPVYFYATIILKHRFEFEGKGSERERGRKYRWAALHNMQPSAVYGRKSRPKTENADFILK